MKIETTPLSDFGIDESILAHSPNETLQEHSDLTFDYYHKIVSSKGLEPLIDNLISKIDSEHFELIKMMFIDAIYLHDLGKENPIFQAKKMSNPRFAEYADSTKSSDHSFLSSQKYIEHYKPKLQSFKRLQRYRLEFILYSFSYAISKHHGRLSQFEEYRKSEKEVKSYQAYLDRFEIPYFEFYILNKLLFSLLVSADYYATNEYMADLKIDNFGTFTQTQKESLQQRFDSFLEDFGEAKGINKLRNEIFKEAEFNLLQNLDKHIYYLEAPTGSGKTITSINLALKLLNSDKRLNKLFYIFPFNTLVEQTKSVFDDVFGDDLKIETINSISPIELEKSQEDSESNYTQSYISRLFFHSEAIITTHVALFNILFGTSKEDNFPLWQLANSVIILDEIQSYNNDLWWYMVEFFDKYAKLLNIKIIIMSATLPKLDFFLEKKSNFIDLISPQKRDEFFTNDYFSKRVEVNFELLEEGEIELDRLEEFFDEVKDGYSKILFEFIKKQSAREFYEQIKEWNKNVYELSGDDNKAYRQYVINKSKEDNPIIIVATQVIEAGVDIDMDLGFKDISTLDSEEQFMGRINRSCKKSGSKVYFFNKDDVAKIYKGDNRLGFDLNQPKYQKILEEKNYADYYNDVLEAIKQNGLRFESGTDTNIDNFSTLVKKLNYQEICNEMKLIDSQNMTLFFPFKIDLEIYKGVKEFEDERIKNYLTDGSLDGEKVWERFKSLNDIEGFSQKKYEQSYINSLMQFFTFNLIKYKEGQKPSHYSCEFGGFFYISNYDDFIEDGKFNREAFQEYTGGYFL
jgi:CRISPR-associated endonuclease/helicase Cas3